MNRCFFETHIEDYLLDRLSGDKKGEFEEHYFNCPRCYEKMVERDELISVIKNKGSEIFKDIPARYEKERTPFYEHIFVFLTPRQWAMAAVSAALLLIVVFGVIPNLRNTSSQFFINEDLVRGKSITLINPLIDTKTVPSQFHWNSLGEDVEYKVYIYNHELLWSTTTTNDFIVLPAGVQEHMISGERYSWEVKAYSKEGTLMAVSSRVQFRIIGEE